MIALKQVNPLPIEAMKTALEGFSYVLIAEEAAAEASIHDSIATHFPDIHFDCLDLGSAYVSHGDMGSLYRHYGLDGQSLADHIWEVGQVEN